VTACIFGQQSGKVLDQQTIERPGEAMEAREHLVQFCDTEDELVNAVVPYLAAGLDADEAVLVIATEPHRLAFERMLASGNSDVESAIAAGTYVSVDAAELLSQLLDAASGTISAEKFDAGVGTLARRQLATGRPLRAYGEIVALMWDRGDDVAAVALEELWSRLQRDDQFTLFCGYPGADAPTHPAALRQVCRSHATMLPAIAEAKPPPGATTASAQFALNAEFAPTTDAPGRVRARLRVTLRDLHFGEDLIERGTLAASELAANAVLHAQTPFRLLIEPRNESVWIAIADEEPLKGRFDVVGRSPHGLGLIAALAVRWGVTPATSGKIVWAEIPM
jgi:MEDS: MEthanogen/methylotroph, DcmR Sensory domain